MYNTILKNFSILIFSRSRDIVCNVLGSRQKVNIYTININLAKGRKKVIGAYINYLIAEVLLKHSING